MVGLGDLAQIFAAELAMHAPGVDAEEEAAEEHETEEQGGGGEEVALAVAGDRGGGESRREECGDGLNVVKDFSEQREVAGGAVMATEAGVSAETAAECRVYR